MHGIGDRLLGNSIALVTMVDCQFPSCLFILFRLTHLVYLLSFFFSEIYLIKGDFSTNVALRNEFQYYVSIIKFFFNLNKINSRALSVK